ncbi:MAG: hypothetical protein ACRC6M_19465 [Microcystaceae cyanobacterium]
MKIRFLSLFLLIFGCVTLGKMSWANAGNNLIVQSQDLIGKPQTQMQPEAQRQHRQKQLDLIRPELYDIRTYPVSDANETHWRKTLWATALLEPQNSQVIDSLVEIIRLAEQPQLLSAAQVRTVQMAMQIGTQLYLADPQKNKAIAQQFSQIIQNSSDPEWVGIALSALVQGGLSPETISEKIATIKKNFNVQNYLALQLTIQDIETLINPGEMPPLLELLNWQIAPQQTQLYVFCRGDRGTLCRAVLKDQKGQFVRDQTLPNKPLWSKLLLTRSLHSLRWNFVRGSSPQGIYRIEGMMPRSPRASFPAYGQFPLVKVFMPFEAGIKAFIPSQTSTFPNNLADYQSLLPPSWQNYLPMHQSYWAGKLGRSLIRIHGSGEFPTFFVNNNRFPQSYGWNPAIGCLSAKELYDQNGNLKEADMPQILKAISQANGGTMEGYLIVTEIRGDNSKPVSLTEIENYLPKK